MKFFKLDLLTLLISLFILGSCKNQDSIGLGATAANQLSGTLIDTSTIIINTIPEDTVVTNALAKTPLGYFKDPVFGTTEADIAMDLNLPSDAAYTLPTGTISIDSAILILRYAPGFYGDSLSSRYKINVYQLNERVYSNATYYNTKQWKYNSSNLLGTKSFLARTHDTITINDILPGIKDSLQRVPPQIRIPINPAFINNVLFNASATQLASNLVFENNVNGLFLTMDKTQTGAGGIFMMAMDSTANINVYYKTINGTTVDTSSVSLPSAIHAAQIKHTYSAAVQTELNNTTTGSRNVIYLDGTAGLRAKIKFPYLKNIAKTIGSNIIINRAELVITPVPGSAIPFPPLQQINMYQYDITNSRVPIQDANSADPRSQGAAVFGGYFSTYPTGYITTSVPAYHFVITAYIQDLMRGATVDYGTFIGPVDLSVGAIAPLPPNPQVAARTFAVGSDKTSPYRITLNIIYTKISQAIPANVTGTNPGTITY